MNRTIINNKYVAKKCNTSNLSWNKNSNSNIITPERLRQLRYNKYEHFTKFVNAMFPDVKSILDVGCGMCQTSILLKQLGYDVTAMDYFSDLQTTKLEYHEIKYIHDYFNEQTEIVQFDLVTGLHCCRGIEKIIRNCLKNDKEFAVTLCETNFGLYQKELIKYRKAYIDYLKGISKILKITMLPIYDPDQKEYWGETIYYKKKKY